MVIISPMLRDEGVVGVISSGAFLTKTRELKF
jgi:hypothetical protein